MRREVRSSKSRPYQSRTDRRARACRAYHQRLYPTSNLTEQSGALWLAAGDLQDVDRHGKGRDGDNHAEWTGTFRRHHPLSARNQPDPQQNTARGVPSRFGDGRCPAGNAGAVSSLAGAPGILAPKRFASPTFMPTPRPRHYATGRRRRLSPNRRFTAVTPPRRCAQEHERAIGGARRSSPGDLCL